MTRIMLFFPHLNKIGGVEKCFLGFCKRFHDKYDITIGYDLESDKSMIKQLSKYAKVEKQDVYIETDIFIQATMYPISPHLIDYKKKGLWVHCIPFIYPNSVITDKEFMKDIDFIICVSDYCTKLIQDYGYKQARTIHNDFNVEEIRKLADEYETPQYDYCYVGRLSTEKGIDNIRKLAKYDRSKQIVIVGCPYEQSELMDMALDQPNITRVGAKQNPYPYMKNSKFTLLLSKFESWGNVITESLIIGTPVIVTNFDTAKEQVIDGINGWILDSKMKELSKIKPLTIEPYDYISNWQEWYNILGD